MKKAAVGLRNTVIHLMDGSSFMIGISLCSYAVIMPSYVKSFTDNALLLALIPVLTDVGPSIPLLVSAYHIRRTRSQTGCGTGCLAIRKYFLPGFLVRLTFPLIGIGILAFSGSRTLSLVSFFILFAFYTVTLGYATPRWIQVLSVTIPNRIRPDFLSFREMIGRFSGIAFSFLVPLILSVSGFPRNYGYLFLISGFIFSAGFLTVPFYRPTVTLPRRPPQDNLKFSVFLAENWRAITANRKLTAFLVIFWSLSVSRISLAYITPFIMDHVLSRLSAREGAFWLSALNTTLLVSMAVSAAMIGPIIRRFGHRTAIILGTVCLFLANVLVVVFPSLQTAFAGNVLIAYFTVAGYLVPLNTYMDLASPHDRPAVMAFASVINAVFIIAFSLIGSAIASFFRYRTALLFAAGLSLVLLIALLGMRRTMSASRRP